MCAPLLDAAQRAVVEHRGGPLLVLAGPGTGKTTTLVEAVVDRVERDGVDPEHILALTFSRRAAAELRQRIAGRLARTVREPLARTFHSYAYGLLRREAVLRGDAAPRLLSGAEQDLLIRELLRGDVEELGIEYWPARLRPALTTRGFADELRDLLMRAAERGVGPHGLAALGHGHRNDAWTAVARFARQYAGVTGLRSPPAYDPAELVRAAVDLLRDDPGLLGQERDTHAFLVVDEYQDSDPAQAELLSLLAGGGRDLIVVGDPDQSIYGFRGAEVEGIRRFADRFHATDGSPAHIVALGVSRRSGQILLAATRRIAARMGGPRGHRVLTPAAADPPGEVSVHVLSSASQEAAFVAGRLRAAHLLGGVPWESMAVLVRSAGALPVLRRGLAGAGVPVAVRIEEVPLVDQPPVR
ncbi:MAG TPA: ATP-dependent helicase, partial [Jiangellaceae bacterium]|nr:ATP-dependent helicase [Jiangellaceae bacterium]